MNNTRSIASLYGITVLPTVFSICASLNTNPIEMFLSFYISKSAVSNTIDFQFSFSEVDTFWRSKHASLAWLTNGALFYSAKYILHRTVRIDKTIVKIEHRAPVIEILRRTNDTCVVYPNIFYI